MRDSHLEREVSTGVEEDHGDVNEADILGFIDVERYDNNDQYNNGELAKYNMVEDSNKPLYHGCAAQYTRLFVKVKNFQLKASNKWSDCSFKDLLTLIKDMLPQGNAVPEFIYEAKQIICLLGLEVEKIHACKNDCILYRGPEYEDLEKCHICRLDIFNHRKDGGDDENCNRNRRKSGPKKVVWYFRIIAHLKHWFANKELELLR
jgi:hypothetical protein